MTRGRPGPVKQLRVVNAKRLFEQTCWDLGAFSAGEITLSLRYLRKVDKTRCFPVLCCCHSDQGRVLGFCKALLGLQTAGQCMSSPALLFCMCVYVNECMCWRPCLCLSGCLRSFVTETVVQTILHCHRNVSFHLSFPYLQQMRNENVHCILEFPIHIQILSFIC